MMQEEWECEDYSEAEIVVSVYVETAEELIARDVAKAHHVLEEFISELTARHMAEMGGPDQQGWLLNINHRVMDHSQNWLDPYGHSHFVKCKHSVEIEITCEYHEFLKRFNDFERIIYLEYLGIPGKWMLKEANALVSYPNTRIMSVRLCKIGL